MRWISINMQINYSHKAKTDVRAIAKIELPAWQNKQDIAVPISMLDQANQALFTAVITRQVSLK